MLRNAWSWLALAALALGSPSCGDSEAPGDLAVAFVCPMHPTVVQSERASCPMCGMDLQPRPIEAARDEAVALAPGVAHQMGLRTVAAKRRSLVRTVRAFGRVAENTAGDQPPITAPVAGEIVAVHVQTHGRQVEANEPLLVIRGESGEEVSVTTPVAGTIKNTFHTVGHVIEAGERLYTIDLARPTTAWGEIFETDAVGLESGDPLVVELPRGVIAEGRLVSLGPIVDPRSRVVDFRAEFTPPKGGIRNNSTLLMRIEAERLEGAVAVPSEAIVDTGERQIVFVSTTGGRYVPRPVMPGLRGDDGFTEIREGLKDGEEVVVSGQFLLDSEAHIEAALARLMATDTSTARR